MDSMQTRLKCPKFMATDVFRVVYLLILVGGVTPQPLATCNGLQPVSNNGENPLWGNACDYQDPHSSSNLEYKPVFARKVEKLAKVTVFNSKLYSKEVAALDSFENFDEVVEQWTTYEWLRNQPWHIPEVLPPQKEYGREVDDQYLSRLMKNVDEILPAMGKSLKLLVAALWRISNYPHLVEPGYYREKILREGLKNTYFGVRGVLCEFDDFMQARHLKIPELLDSEITVEDASTIESRINHIRFVYRDTINYLEYLVQIFRKIQQSGR